jgi:solute carrier family 10 (sodium/bile acid cotransporter), member 7
LRAELLIGKFGVACIFLLSGLSLELSELTKAAANHKLNASVLLTTFVGWPMFVGVPLVTLLETTFPNILPAPLRDGLLIMTCLPTTINMCVILTTAAGGSVATALWNAVISNMAGIFITPLLLLRFFGKYIQLPFLAMVLKLCSQVLLPVGMYISLSLFGISSYEILAVRLTQL